MATNKNVRNCYIIMKPYCVAELCSICVANIFLKLCQLCLEVMTFILIHPDASPASCYVLVWLLKAKYMVSNEDNICLSFVCKVSLLVVLVQ